MKGKVIIDEKEYEVDFSNIKDISIPLIFNGKQPNTYKVEKAISQVYEDGAFIGDTRKGGPCNFETYSLTPHCNGTHTECIGHLTNERINILSSLKNVIIPSTLISIIPKSTTETYMPDINQEDLLITKEDLQKKLKDISKSFLQSLIIRTLPNTEEKLERDYMQEPSPFFSLEAMQYIADLNVEHLLVDTPSVDRLLDEGLLNAHNLFWKTEEKIFNKETKNKTITEMIFVPNNVKDGQYLLNLQIAPFLTDASPSRPILFTINEV